MDEAGLLDPLGIHTFFDGVDAGGIHVREALAENPMNLSTSIQPMTGDNDRVLDLIQLEGERRVNSMDFHDYYRDLVGHIATTRNNRAAQLHNLEEIGQSLEDARDAVSGVSVDEEMLRIFQGQRLYQGLTKYVKSLDSAYRDLFRIL